MEYRSIKKWPEEERPRERLLQNGAAGLSTAELCAIVLRTGSRDISALELAREVLASFGTLKGIEDAAAAEFDAIKGMGNAKVSQLKASFELGRRLLQSEGGCVAKALPFRRSQDIYEYYRPRFFGLKKERFICALLDSKNRVYRESIVSEGTLNSTPVHPREVFRDAIKDAAASVMFIHNHPSGDPNPSRDDITITRRLAETGKVIGIKVLDHIIVCDGAYVSLCEKGYID